MVCNFYHPPLSPNYLTNQPLLPLSGPTSAQSSIPSIWPNKLPTVAKPYHQNCDVWPRSPSRQQPSSSSSPSLRSGAIFNLFMALQSNKLGSAPILASLGFEGLNRGTNFCNLDLCADYQLQRYLYAHVLAQIMLLHKGI